MLIDLILAQKQISHQMFREGEDATPTAFNRAIEDVPKFDVQNVCDYYFNSHVEGWDNWREGYPCSMPPFNRMWMETGRPKNEEKSDLWPLRWGVLLQLLDFPDDSDWREKLGSPPDPARMYLVVATLMYQAAVGSLVNAPCETLLTIDPEGQIWGVPGVLPREGWERHFDDDKFLDGLGCIFRPLLLALSFLHCKNVQKVEHRPDAIAGSRPLTAAERKGKTTAVRYYTLNIQPMRKILRTEGRIGEVGLKKALHICRGHFASYTEDKPLFGKLSGRFWIPAHVRGSKDAGEIKKDYKVTGIAQ